MSGYGISIELDVDLATARERVIAALAEQCFGVLTEIDIAATEARAKLTAALHALTTRAST